MKVLQKAGKELAKAEKELVKLRAKVARLRKKAARMKVSDYVLLGPGGRETKLSSLFGRKKDLIVIHNMGRHCPYCTLWADGFNGTARHFEDRAGFALVSPDAPAVQQEFARKRGWRFNILSGEGSTFIKDMGFETKDGHAMPGISAFRREKDGSIVRTGAAGFGPGDEFCPAWHMFDLLADGHGGWQPKFFYKEPN